MTARRAPGLYCLVVGLLASDECKRTRALTKLSARFGAPFYVSAPLPFTRTSYYEREMGTGLNRRLAAFCQLVREGCLPLIKKHCISLEHDFSAQGKRALNLDPGLLNAGSLILASTKAAAHRLPIGGGIYGELTLLWQSGMFNPLPWTYPDYASQTYRELYSGLRSRYLWQLTTKRI